MRQTTSTADSIRDNTLPQQSQAIPPRIELSDNCHGIIPKQRQKKLHTNDSILCADLQIRFFVKVHAAAIQITPLLTTAYIYDILFVTLQARPKQDHTLQHLHRQNFLR